MNGRRAKKLRGIAQARTVGRSQTAYRQVERGNPKYPELVTVVDPQCTRGVYLALKKKERRA